jgi:proline iminopeptidase
LHEAWPEAEYILLPDAGHVAFEPSIARELVAATEHLKRRLRAR